MPALPRGTVAFLFTDIEGSTRLWERHREAMSAALARHDALLREAIEAHGGHVFNTAGDAFCAVFAVAHDALAAACAAQRALVREPWPAPVEIRARMALHVGTAELRDHDYFGPPLNRVARVLAAGHGGQVLLTRTATELVRDSLPPDASLRDLGERRLKDLVRPEHVYQLVLPDLPSEFPALRTLDARPHNLPIQLTRFIGREDAMREAEARLRRDRLVTLTGPGGAGKTRLSLQVAGEMSDEFADGVWLVELAALADPDLVPQAVAAVLGLREQPGTRLIDTLASECAQKEILLVLDNCEHLIDACARLCASLLSAAGRVRILASSREPLRVPGEVVQRVPPLEIPEAASHVSAEAVAPFAAVELFVDRAVAAQPSFRFSDGNAIAVARICRRLDGIPLALELAASRLRSLSVEDVDRRLDQRFRLLTGGSRTALPRQQTLRSLIDWSHDLLAPGEQAVLRRMAVFAGGFTAEDAEQVCASDGVDAFTVLDYLTSLVDKSLVVVDERGDGTRYRLLETVREYALERLRDHGEERRFHDRHLDHFLALAERAEPELTGARQHSWLDRLELEHDNLRAALAWCARADGGDLAAGLRLAGALQRFWSVRGKLAEGRALLTSLLDATADRPPDAARAKALRGAGIIAWQQGDYAAARSFHEASLALYRSVGDGKGEANALCSLGVVLSDENDYAGGRARLAEALALARRIGDRRGVAVALINLGVVAYRQGDRAAARGHYEEGLAVLRDLGDRHSAATTVNALGLILMEQGDYAAAQRLYEEALATARELGDRQGIAMSLNHLGMVAARQDERGRALALFEECLALNHELGNRREAAAAMSNLGGLARLQGDLAEARAQLAASLTISHGIGDHRGMISTLVGLAECVTNADRVARILGVADRLRGKLRVELLPSEQEGADALVAAARAALGEAAFATAWEDGKAMALPAAVAYAREAAGVLPEAASPAGSAGPHG